MKQGHESTTANGPTTTVRWVRPGVAHVVLGGEHDLSSAEKLGAVLSATLDECSHLVVDVTTTEFVDSSTILALVTAKRRADASGSQFHLVVGTASIVTRALELTNVVGTLNGVGSLDKLLEGGNA
jgi:anti-anti-sigma factor